MTGLKLCESCNQSKHVELVIGSVRDRGFKSPCTPPLKLGYSTTYIAVVKKPNGATYKNPIYAASIDRINGDLGYRQGNVRFVSIMANLARSLYPDEFVISFAKLVTENQR